MVRYGIWYGTQCSITYMLFLIFISMSMLDTEIGLGDAYFSFHV